MGVLDNLSQMQAGTYPGQRQPTSGTPNINHPAIVAASSMLPGGSNWASPARRLESIRQGTFAGQGGSATRTGTPDYIAGMTNGGGTGTGTGTPTPTVDPFAKWGGQAEYNKLVSGFTDQKNNIFSSASDAIKTAGRNIRGGVLDFIDSYRTGQQGIDERYVQNELGKQVGRQGVLDMVGRGVRSGGVMLANNNSGTSSAGDAIARAYGDIGRRDLSKVGNAYEGENRSIGIAEQGLQREVANFDRDYEDEKLNVVDSVVSKAQDSLSALDVAMQNASLPERIAIEQEKQRIRNEAMAELAQYDKLLAEQRATVKPMSAEQRRAEATNLRVAGTVPANDFNFTSEVPAQFQGTGPFSSELPIFTYRGRGREE